MPPATVPCQYRTGKTLGTGTYAVVKEAMHIETKKYYACKVINKRLMEGREHMVRNEISVLKRISQGHPNVVTLVDYFETMNNLYLVTDLCTGGELFDRICAKGSYYERDACQIVRVITGAVEYLHSQGIVHRDLKPENLLFRSPDENSELLIADFGLSRIMDNQKLTVLTTTCGTPGYMAPEIFRKEGHSKPVDVWAIGVITYFLCAGYTPFDRETNIQEIQAICAADYKFEPAEYWEHVSDTARDFIRVCLTVDQHARPTASQLLQHPWLSSEAAMGVVDPSSTTGEMRDLLPNIRKQFDAKKTFRKAVWSVRWINATQKAAAELNAEEKEIQDQVNNAKAEAENEQADQVFAAEQ